MRSFLLCINNARQRTSYGSTVQWTSNKHQITFEFSIDTHLYQFALDRQSWVRRTSTIKRNNEIDSANIKVNSIRFELENERIESNEHPFRFRFILNYFFVFVFFCFSLRPGRPQRLRTASEKCSYKFLFAFLICVRFFQTFTARCSRL